MWLDVIFSAFLRLLHMTRQCCHLLSLARKGGCAVMSLQVFFYFVAVCPECSLLLHGCIVFVGTDYCAFCRPGVPSDVSCRVAVQIVRTASFSAVPCARLPASSRAFCALSLSMCHVTHALFDAAAFLPRRSGHA